MRKTNIAGLTRAVGIAQGSFYLFFTSKEDLYFEVLEEEEEEVKIKQSLPNEFLDQPLKNLQSLFDPLIPLSP